eukprot:g7553.t1
MPEADQDMIELDELMGDDAQIVDPEVAAAAAAAVAGMDEDQEMQEALEAIDEITVAVPSDQDVEHTPMEQDSVYKPPQTDESFPSRASRSAAGTLGEWYLRDKRNIGGYNDPPHMRIEAAERILKEIGPVLDSIYKHTLEDASFTNGDLHPLQHAFFANKPGPIALRMSPQNEQEQWRLGRFLAYHTHALLCAVRYANPKAEAKMLQECADMATFLKYAGDKGLGFVQIGRQLLTLFRVYATATRADGRSFRCHPVVQMIFSEKHCLHSAVTIQLCLLWLRCVVIITTPKSHFDVTPKIKKDPHAPEWPNEVTEGTKTYEKLIDYVGRTDPAYDLLKPEMEFSIARDRVTKEDIEGRVEIYTSLPFEDDGNQPPTEEWTEYLRAFDAVARRRNELNRLEEMEKQRKREREALEEEIKKVQEGIKSGYLHPASTVENKILAGKEAHREGSSKIKVGDKPPSGLPPPGNHKNLATNTTTSILKGNNATNTRKRKSSGPTPRAAKKPNVTFDEGDAPEDQEGKKRKVSKTDHKAGLQAAGKGYEPIDLQQKAKGATTNSVSLGNYLVRENQNGGTSLLEQKDHTLSGVLKQAPRNYKINFPDRTGGDLLPQERLWQGETVDQMNRVRSGPASSSTTFHHGLKADRGFSEMQVQGFAGFGQMRNALTRHEEEEVTPEEALRQRREAFRQLQERDELEQQQFELMQKMRTRNAELHKLQRELVQAQPDAGRTFLDHAYGTSAMYPDREDTDADEESSEDPTAGLFSTKHPDGLSGVAVGRNLDQYMERPRTASHIGKARAKDEIPDEFWKLVVTSTHEKTRVLNPRLFRVARKVAGDYLKARNKERGKDLTGDFTVTALAQEMLHAIAKRSTILRYFDMIDEDCVEDALEDLIILALSGKLKQKQFDDQVDKCAAGEKVKLDEKQTKFPLGVEVFDRALASFEQIAHRAITDTGNNYSLLKITDRKTYSLIKTALDKVRKDVLACSERNDMDPMSANKENAQKALELYRIRDITKVAIHDACGFYKGENQRRKLEDLARRLDEESGDYFRVVLRDKHRIKWLQSLIDNLSMETNKNPRVGNLISSLNSWLAPVPGPDTDQLLSDAKRRERIKKEEEQKKAALATLGKGKKGKGKKGKDGQQTQQYGKQNQQHQYQQQWYHNNNFPPANNNTSTNPSGGAAQQQIASVPFVPIAPAGGKQHDKGKGKGSGDVRPKTYKTDDHGDRAKGSIKECGILGDDWKPITCDAENCKKDKGHVNAKAWLAAKKRRPGM